MQSEVKYSAAPIPVAPTTSVTPTIPTTPITPSAPTAPSIHTSSNIHPNSRPSLSSIDGLAITAHELKAPFTLLRQLALSLELTKDTDSVKRISSRMVSVSERALKQIQDLTKISRLEDGLFQMEPVSVRSVCDDVITELTQLFNFQQRSLGVKYTNRSRLVIANRDLLHSVIYNFCLNALHYSNAGTQSILTVKDQKPFVLVNIRDFGPALPRKIWQDLRSGTFNQPTPISMRPGSSGLGLYIASKFSHYMHAEIGATRHRDGTSFFVRLPVSTQATLW